MTCQAPVSDLLLPGIYVLQSSLKVLLLQIGANATSLQIELLYNRANNMTYDDIFEVSGNVTKLKRGLSSSCELCTSSALPSLQGTFDEKLLNEFMLLWEGRWYEGPGYYSLLDEEDTSSLIEPKNELKEMMDAQATYFGINRDYSIDAIYTVPLTYNEFAINGDTIQ